MGLLMAFLWSEKGWKMVSTHLNSKPTFRLHLLCSGNGHLLFLVHPEYGYAPG